jgi:hypothetical protein
MSSGAYSTDKPTSAVTVIQMSVSRGAPWKLGGHGGLQNQERGMRGMSLQESEGIHLWWGVSESEGIHLWWGVALISDDIPLVDLLAMGRCDT